MKIVRDFFRSLKLCENFVTNGRAFMEVPRTMDSAGILLSKVK